MTEQKVGTEPQDKLFPLLQGQTSRGPIPFNHSAGQAGPDVGRLLITRPRTIICMDLHKIKMATGKGR